MVVPFRESDAPAGTGILQLRHMPEKAVFLCKELCRTSFFGHSAIGQNDDLIRRFHSTHTVGDNQHRFAGEQPRQSALNPGFILHIKRGRRLIQEHDGGIL